MTETNITLELIREYRRLSKEEPDRAEDFLEANKDNEFFYSLVDFGKKLIPAMVAQADFMIDGINAARTEDDPIIREALLEHIKVEFTARIMEEVGVGEPQTFKVYYTKTYYTPNMDAKLDEDHYDTTVEADSFEEALTVAEDKLKGIDMCSSYRSPITDGYMFDADHKKIKLPSFSEFENLKGETI